VGTGVGVTGAISSSSDQDWFYFDVSASGNINISLNIGSSADLDWFLYNSSLTEVARGYSTANPEVGNYSATPGRYYLMVDGYQTAVSSYTLTVNGGLANVIIPMQKDFAPETQATPVLVTSLLQNSPNPFRDLTAIQFTLAQPGRVREFDPSSAGPDRSTRTSRPARTRAVARRQRGGRTCRPEVLYRLVALRFYQTGRCCSSNPHRVRGVVSAPPPDFREEAPTFAR
jgi:hypothetical protein